MSNFEQHAATVNDAAAKRAVAANHQYEDAVWRHAEVSREVRDMVRAKTIRRQYEAVPGAIIHHDGVIELPN